MSRNIDWMFYFIFYWIYMLCIKYQIICFCLFKFHVVSDSFAYIYENITVSDTGGSVLRDLFVDEEQEHLTIGISSDHVSQVNMKV